MNRFVKASAIEFKKNLNLKVLLVFVVLAIVVALIAIPLFENNGFSDEAPSEEFIKNELERLESKYLAAKDAYEKSPETERVEAEYISAKYQYENQVLAINQISNSRSNFLLQSGLCVLGIFGLVIIFAGMITTREYSTKNILSLSTSPIRKSYYFLAKFLTLIVFSFIVTVVFFVSLW